MPNTGDYIEGSAGEESGNIVVGKGIRQRVDSPSADAGRDHEDVHGNQVHIAMERLSDVSEREAATILALSRQIESLTAELTALTRALIGDSRFGSLGLVHQVKEMDLVAKSRERWRVVSTWMLIFLLVSQVIQGWLLWEMYSIHILLYQAAGN